MCESGNPRPKVAIEPGTNRPNPDWLPKPHGAAPARRDGPRPVIDKLEVVLALARERHFGRAADALGISQPALSAALRSLEDALGVTIVNRSSRFQGFTPEGERVLGWARRIVADAKAMRDDLRAARHGLAGPLRIAVIPTALAAVAQLTAPFLARHPDVTISVLSRSSDEVVRMLADLEVDAGLTYLDNEPLGPVSTMALYPERYCLLTAADGALGGRAEVSWAEVGREPLCLLTPDMQNRRIVDRHLRSAGCTPAPLLVSDSTIVLLAHVRAGPWSTVVAERLIEVLDLHPRIRAVPIGAGEPGFTVGLAVPAREPGTPIAAALLAEARALARTFGKRVDAAR